MRKRQVQIIVGLLLCLVTALAVPQAAMAAGTPACTQIGNTASIAYQVGGFAQLPVSSLTNTLTVGNKVDHTVVTLDAMPGVPVVSNQAGVVLTFTITNNGNANQTYVLTATDLLSGVTTSVFGNNSVTDSFNTFSKATSVATTGIVTAGSTTTVTIIATMPGGLTPLDTYAVLALTAQAYKIDGITAEANNSSSINSSAGTCAADVVLGDVAGTDDVAKDGKNSARSAYHAVLTNLNVAKTSIVYNDPVNGTISPKAIPLANMEYTVVITNPAGSPGNATAITVSDTLNANLTPVNGLWSSTNGGGVSCTNAAVATINGGPWTCLGGGWAGQTVTAVVPALNTGQTATVLFQATIK